jgi:hypothetical protein
MMKMSVRNVRVKVTAQYHRAGSVLAGTAKAGCDSVRTELHLDSDEPADRVAQLIRMSEESCYTIGAIREPTPCELVAVVNDKPFAVDLG